MTHLFHANIHYCWLCTDAPMEYSWAEEFGVRRHFESVSASDCFQDDINLVMMRCEARTKKRGNIIDCSKLYRVDLLQFNRDDMHA